MVVNHIAEKYGFYREQTINYNVGWGRADLISSSGYVWDVKRDKEKQISSCVAQVQKYVNNTWKRYPNRKLKTGYSIKTGSFVKTLGLDTYYISYRYARGGVIAYDYYKITDWEAVKEGAAATGMAVLAFLALLAKQASELLQYIPA